MDYSWIFPPRILDRGSSTNPGASVIYRFDKFRVDATTFEVWGDDARLAAQPQVIELLILLIENRDRVISREEIFERIWKNRIVSDTTLSSRIKSVRKLLGDDGANQRFVRTVHGRGFRFLAEVETLQSPSIDTLLQSANRQAQANTRPDASLFSAEAYKSLTGEQLVLPAKPSIAVLPFHNPGGEAEQEYFADGMSDDIITALSRVPDLVVIARNSTFIYRGRDVDIRQVGQDLAVGNVLEGSVRKAGDRLRVNVQLVDTQNGHQVWAERFDRKLDDIFSIQDEIANSIVINLQIRLVAGDDPRLAATATSNVKAWELMVCATPLSDTAVRDDAMLARQLARQALELDSEYAAAWSVLGWVCWQESIFNWSADPAKSMQMAYDAANRAIALDARFSKGYALLGHVCLVRGDIDQAIAMSEKAIELAPGDSHGLAFYANVLIDSGRIRQGIQYMKRAIRLCPFPPGWYFSLLGTGLHLDGDNETAIQVLEQAVRREPNSHLPRLWLASALVESNRLEEAAAVSRAVLDIEPDFSAVDWAGTFRSASHARLEENLLAAGFPE